MLSTKVQKIMRKTRRSRGRNAEFYVIELTPAADQSTDFHIGEELTAEQRDNFRSLLYDDFPELLQHVDSPHLSRHWDHPIEATGPMRRQRLNILSPLERAEIEIKIEIEIAYNMYRMRRFYTQSRMRRLLSLGPPNYAIQGTYKSGLDR
jgi:hypothetical protein